MVYFLTFLSALLSIIGNITSKYWTDHGQNSVLFITILTYNISTFCYLYALRMGRFTLINGLFYAIVPLITVLYGLIFFKDHLTPLQIAGLTLGLISIILFTLEGKFIP